MEKKHFINIAQIKIAESPEDVLIASNLGSCLGIGVFDPETKAAGLVHCLLPLSKSDSEKADKNPCMYVDTGFTFLLNQILSKGGNKQKLKIVVAGGANINDEENVFEIGKKNYTILKKLLWKNGLLLKAEDVGGSVSRTLTMNAQDGKCFLKINGETKEFGE